MDRASSPVRNRIWCVCVCVCGVPLLMSFQSTTATHCARTQRPSTRWVRSSQDWRSEALVASETHHCLDHVSLSLSLFRLVANKYQYIKSRLVCHLMRHLLCLLLRVKRLCGPIAIEEERATEAENAKLERQLLGQLDLGPELHWLGRREVVHGHVARVREVRLRDEALQELLHVAHVLERGWLIGAQSESAKPKANINECEPWRRWQW